MVRQKDQLITVVGRVSKTRHNSKNTNKEKFFIYCGNNKTAIDGYNQFRVVMFSKGIQNLVRVENLNTDDLRKWKSKYIKITGILDIERNKTPLIVLKESTQLKLINTLEENQLLSQTYIPVNSPQIKQPSPPPQHRQQNLSKTQSPQSANPLNTPNQITSPTKQPSPPPQVPSQYRKQTISSTQRPQNLTSSNQTSKQSASQAKKSSSASQVTSQYYKQSLSQTQSPQSANLLNTPNQITSPTKQPSPPPQVPSQYRQQTISSKVQNTAILWTLLANFCLLFFLVLIVGLVMVILVLFGLLFLFTILVMDAPFFAKALGLIVYGIPYLIICCLVRFILPKVDCIYKSRKKIFMVNLTNFLTF